MNELIPEEWAKVSLDDIGHIQTGNTPTKKKPEYYGGLFPIFKPTDLNSTQVITKASEYLSDEGKSVARRIPANSTYVTCIGATIGKTGFVAVEGTCNQQINTISPYQGIVPKWVYYWLISPNMNYEIISNSSSTTLPIINKSRFSCLTTVLPPLAEQKVIADKLDELLAQVESTKARLDAIPAILKSFRQSVLAAAVSGKLTEEWRGANKSSPIYQLLDEVDQRRFDKKSEKFASKPFRPDEVTLEIPNEWEWVRLAKIAEVVSGVAKGSKSKDEIIELPYLRVANVQRGYLDLGEIKHISVSANKAKNLYLEEGDILFNEGGDIDKLGRGWIWEGQVKNCIHQNHVFRARVYSHSIQSKYLSHYGNSEGKEYFLREGTQSVNLANINKTTLSLLPIPLPPVEEQTEIVRRVEELFAFADKVEAQVNAAQLRVNNLTQSILAKAFRGELTADWRAANPSLISGDNSAAALLERIKAEREALATKKTSKRKKA